MKRFLCCLFLLSIALMMTSCQPPEATARDTAAALGGLLAAAQTQNQSACQADATQSVCVLIDKGIAAQNALVTATEAYCGWSATTPPGDPSAKCVSVASATAGLQTAITNANTFITELKGVIK